MFDNKRFLLLSLFRTILQKLLETEKESCWLMTATSVVNFTFPFIRKMVSEKSTIFDF